jgi:hypothetical protein
MRRRFGPIDFGLSWTVGKICLREESKRPVNKIGATAKLYGLVLEPFLYAGYQALTMSDHDAGTTALGIRSLSSLDNERKDAVMGAGISIRY